MKINGFTLIEIIISIGLAALILPALFIVFSFSLSSASQGESFTKAYAFAQEQIEAMYYLRGQDEITWDWDDSTWNTGANEYYQPNKDSGSWQIGTKKNTPPVIDTIGYYKGYYKKVEIKEVRRYPGSSDITDDPMAPIDNSTRKIIVTIGWIEKDPLKPQEVILKSYVTRH